MNTRQSAAVNSILLLFATSVGCGGDAVTDTTAGEVETPPARPTVAESKVEEPSASAADPKDVESPSPLTNKTPLGSPSFSEVVSVIDLRDVALPKPSRMAQPLAGFYSCVAGLPLNDAKAFLHEQLVNLGCEEASSDYDEQAASHTLVYRKDGYTIEATITKQAPLFGKEASALVVFNQGRLDARELPRPDDATTKIETAPAVSCETEAGVADVVEQLRPRLAEVGWREFVDENTAALGAIDGFRMAGFVKAGHKLQVVAQAQADAGRTTVNYGMGVRNFDLPAPADADGFTLNDTKGTLACRSGRPLAELTEFYRDHYTGAGWERNDKFGHVRDESATLVYDRGANSTWVELVQDENEIEVRLKVLAK